MPLAPRDTTMTDWQPVDDYLDALTEVVRDGHHHPHTHPDVVTLTDLLGRPLPHGAACAKLDWWEADAVFHPEDVTVADLARARALYCNTSACPALRECLRRALENNPRHGIWAGTSRRQRMRIRVLIRRASDPDKALSDVLDDFEAGATARYEQLATDPDEAC